MELEISQREIDGLVILDLRGRLLMGESESLLRRTILALRSRGRVKVILNFEELKDIDDDGLSALVYCCAVLRRAGGDLKLASLDRVHMELLVMVKLDSVFDVFEDENDAINSFFPDRDTRRLDVLAFVKSLR